MDPVSLVLGLLVVTGCLHVTARVVADSIATVRAAKADQWGVIDRDRDRRAARADRWAQAWKEVRARRHRAAGGDGDYRPGVKAYAGDVYHGFWEGQMAKRQAKRAARPEAWYDPDRKPWHVRFDEAVLDKVARARQRWGQYVPSGPTTETVVEPASVSADPDLFEPGTWTVGDDGERTPLGPNLPSAIPQGSSTPDAPQVAPPEAPSAAARPADSYVQLRRQWADPDWDRLRAEAGVALDQADWAAAAALMDEMKARFPEAYARAGLQTRAANGVFSHRRLSDVHDEAARQTWAAAPDTALTGGNMTAPADTATEVQTNEDARRNFQIISDAASEAQEALVQLETARAKMAAAAHATSDGMSAKAFDGRATSAAGEAVDAIGLDTLAGWADKIDGAKGAADQGLSALNKYRDAESQVAEERIDPTVLAPTSL